MANPDEETVTVSIPKGGSVLMVLAAVGDALWIMSTVSHTETLRAIHAALKAATDSPDGTAARIAEDAWQRAKTR
jgi:hypothetical protein